MHSSQICGGGGCGDGAEAEATQVPVRFRRVSAELRASGDSISTVRRPAGRSAPFLRRSSSARKKIRSSSSGGVSAARGRAPARDVISSSCPVRRLHVDGHETRTAAAADVRTDGRTAGRVSATGWWVGGARPSSVVGVRTHAAVQRQVRAERPPAPCRARVWSMRRRAAAALHLDGPHTHQRETTRREWRWRAGSGARKREDNDDRLKHGARSLARWSRAAAAAAAAGRVAVSNTAIRYTQCPQRCVNRLHARTGTNNLMSKIMFIITAAK